MRDDAQVEAFVAGAAERWGGVDVVVNNASAINLAPIADLPPKRYDLMLDINTRGTYLLTRAALPHLRESSHAHVLTLSPPLSTDPRWLRGHAAYTVSKMGMTMLTLGVAEDERENGVGANCLWPRTLIATAAVQNLLGGDEAMARARTPEIVADAARVILERDPREATGNAYMDDEVLAEAGITDLERYRARRGRARAGPVRGGLAGASLTSQAGRHLGSRVLDDPGHGSCHAACAAPHGATVSRETLLFGRLRRTATRRCASSS